MDKMVENYINESSIKLENNFFLIFLKQLKSINIVLITSYSSLSLPFTHMQIGYGWPGLSNTKLPSMIATEKQATTTTNMPIIRPYCTAKIFTRLIPLALWSRGSLYVLMCRASHQNHHCCRCR